ncbi:GLUG motif-containing protein [Methylosinus sp. 3S-1]|nr:hypothetical protein A8B73_11630 [Methylosinus sp. 3S-1]
MMKFERKRQDSPGPANLPTTKALDLVVRRGALTTMTAIAALLAPPRCALANPAGGTVVDGSASISQSGSTTNIHQSTNRAIIDWQSFSVGAGETVNFYQPSSLSATLNRVIGNERSVIDGAINANGAVFLVNSAGVMFTHNATVNVGGLVASTLGISNSDFMAGNYRFSGSSAASVVNRGNIRASDGGYIALLGRTVSNEGAIVATLGSIALASGDKITLNFGGDSLVDVSIDKGTYKALVANKGLIQADGGRVVMTAKAADAVLSAQVNNSGIVQARTLSDLTGAAAAHGTVRIGKIKLLASGGTTKVTGKLDASAPQGGRGGEIDTSGDRVKIADSAVITTASATGQNGNWVIDPDGFTIAAAGGDITGAMLSSQLGSNNVTILSTSGGGSDGDINVNDLVNWSQNTTLTLTATNAINVNAVLTGSGTGSGLVLNAGTDVNVNAPSSLQVASLVATAGGDVNINAAQDWTTAGSWSFSGANINVNDTVDWSAGTLTLNAASFINLNAVMTASDQASLVATYNTAIDQTLDADGVATSTYGEPLGGIKPLYDSATGTYVGRIDFVNNSAAAPLTINGNAYTLITSVSQLDMLDGKNSVTGEGDAVSLEGFYALAINLNACGAVSATCAAAVTYSSPLIDFLSNGSVLEGLGHDIANLRIAADYGNGGLLRYNSGVVRDLSLSNVSLAYTSGNQIGALIGVNGLFGQIFNVSANGAIDLVTTDTGGTSITGGLVGQNSGLIQNSHAHVDIRSVNGNSIGGFVGTNFGGPANHTTAIILDSTASGDVRVSATNSNYCCGGGAIGGFAGANKSGSIYRSSASGNVTVDTYGSKDTSITGVGGFVGQNWGQFATSIIDSSVATGNVIVLGGNVDFVGGFYGSATNTTISNSSFLGTISAPTPGTIYKGIESNTEVIGVFGGNMDPGVKLVGNLYHPGVSGPSNSIGRVADGMTYDVKSTTSTEPSSGQGAPTSTTAQDAAAARQRAANSTQQATAQRQAVADAAAARAEAVQAAPRVANVLASATAAEAASPSGSAVAATAGKRAVEARAADKLDDRIDIEEPAPPRAPPVEKKRPQRQAAATPAHKPRGAGQGSGFGTRIRSIDAGGQHYELNDGSAAPKNR